jgi:hypothetical protein
MKFVLKSKSLSENLLKEASSKDITQTLVTAVIREMAKYYATYLMELTPRHIYEIDVSGAIEKLKKISPKYDVALKKIDWKMPLPGMATEGFAYIPETETIKIVMGLPYNQEELDIYKESLKKPKVSEEMFNKTLHKNLLSILKDNRRVLQLPESERTLDRLKAIAKAPENTLKVPEFTTSAILNKKNLATTSIKGPFPLLNQNGLNDLIKSIKPGPHKMGAIYKMFARKGFASGIENQIDRVLSFTYHEMKHARQFSSEKNPETGRAVKAEDFAKLFNKENLLLLPDNIYEGNSTALPQGPVDRFYYWSRPYEIDARAEEYRKLLHKVKKSDPQNAGSKLFEYILRVEMEHAQRSIPSPRVPQFSPELRSNGHLIKDELTYKCLSQVFNQIANNIKDISRTDSRYKEKADEFAQKVAEINGKIKTELGFFVNQQDPLERLPLVRGEPTYR